MGVFTNQTLRLKKIGLMAVISLLTLLYLPANAQVRDWKTVNVQVAAEGKPLRDILKELEKQIGSEFSYDESELNLNQQISFRFEGSLHQAFQELGRLASLDFLQTSKAITIRHRRATLNVTDSRMISGVVHDQQDKSPLPGVTVIVKGTNKATMTNMNGEFSFRLVKENIPATVLEFRFLGMKSREVQVGSQSKFEVGLEQEANAIKEVVVTGAYTGERRREEVVGSISQLTSRELQVDRPIESFDKMLEGMVAGVQVETTTELNKPVKINIRGQNSLTSFGGSRSTSTQPLYVVDGVPMYEQQKGDESTYFGPETFLNPLSNINPQDIESIAVLKDASASALYGADAANGVIIITTKAGQVGKTRLNVSYNTGVSSFINELKYLSGPQYYELKREALINNGFGERTASNMAGSPDTDTDWFGLTTRNGVYHNANVEMSGGKEGTTYRLSAGYTNQQSGAVGNDMQKMFMRLRLDHEISSKLKMSVNLSPSLTNQSSLSNYGAIILPPNMSPYNEDGSFNEMLNFNVPNPIAVLEQNEDSHRGAGLTGTANARYKLTESISFAGTVGGDFYKNQQTKFFSALNQTGRSRDGWLRIYNREKLSWIAFMQGMYDKTFLEKHTVNFLLGTQAQDEETNLLHGSGSGFSYDRIRELSQAQTMHSSSSKNARAAVSYYSQLGYDFKKKYFLNLNARADKSSVFGGDRQVALNGSVGLGWNVTKERFLQPNHILNELRLRTSFGSTGNSRIGSYAARGLYLFNGTSNYNGGTGSIPDGSAAPNPNLGWERSVKFNAGVDMSLFNRFSITAEVYRNTIKDLISSVNVPLETGFSTISANTGEMQNQGVELTIRSENIRLTDFRWDTRLNFGLNRNKITKFNRGFTAQYSVSDAAAVTRVGISTGSIWGFEWGGVDPTTGEEFFYDNYGNVLNARQIQALPISEGRVIGDRLPRFEGGMVNTFAYKNLSLSFNLLYSYGASFLAPYTVQADGRNLDHRNQSVNLIDRWQKEGDITNVPKLYFPRDIVRNSSRYLHDLTYLKLSNVSLSYQLPEWLQQTLHMRNASVFVNGTNLLYWYREQSPEGRNGVAELRFVTPEMMTVSGGFNIGF